MTNLAAFLSMVSASEGTDKYPDPYAVLFGGKAFTDFSDHPAIVGPWKGEKLDFLGPMYIGLVSTAAGRYQINRPTWKGIQLILKLPDFGPSSQDAAAVQLIKEHNAIELVNEGNIEASIAACAPVWASLAGSASGQPQHPVATLISWYQNAGGALA